MKWFCYIYKEAYKSWKYPFTIKDASSLTLSRRGLRTSPRTSAGSDRDATTSTFSGKSYPIVDHTYDGKFRVSNMNCKG